MRNQLGHKAIKRLVARITSILNRPKELRRAFVGVLSGALVLGGAVAFTYGLFTAAPSIPGLLIGAAISSSAGAIAILLNRSGRTSQAILLQTLSFGLFGLVTALATEALFAGVALIALSGLHATIWSDLKSIFPRFFAVLGMTALSTLLFAVMPNSAFWGAALIVTLIDILAVVTVFSKRRNQLTAADQALSNLLESISDGLVRLSADGSLLHASPATENMFGCKAYSLARMGMLERVHVLDRPAFLKAVSDTCHDGLARRVELRMRRDANVQKRGESQFIWSEIAICGAPENAGKPTVYGLIRDISERKTQEQKLEDARQEAEQASSSKSLFLATMGHELRTPLNAIVGFAEMMTSGIGGTLEDTHAEYAALIGQSGRHLLDVVNMLLDMSKLNAGKFELHLEEYEPDNLVEPSLHMVSAMARTRRVHLHTDVAAQLPIVRGDERACRQIVINLLSNAIKFSNTDGVVSLSIRRQGAKLSITVSDQGIGMTREQVARIGEPFFQAHAGLARQYEGTGLGLSIVKGLVELHDGVLRAKSSPDDGTTITVLLPLLGPEADQQETSITPLRPPESTAEPIQIETPGKQSVAS